ncbi:MAG: HAMP domain-containing protein, partial [Gemmatimonadetes bacterium]
MRAMTATADRPAVDPGAARGEGVPLRSRAAVRTILRTPLLYKLLLPNLGLLALGLAAGLVLHAHLDDAHGTATLVAGFVAIVLLGLIAGTVLNVLLLRTALAPVRELEETAARIEAGDLSARAAVLRTADDSLSRLTTVFNRSLDEYERRRAQDRLLSARALRAEEEERTRSSRELYDDLAQTLAGALVRFRLMEQAEAERDEERARGLRAEIRSELLEALEGVRGVARRLHPPELEELGLRAALDAYTRRVAEDSGVPVRVSHAAAVEDRLSPETRLAVFRVVQEAVRNAVSHA